MVGMASLNCMSETYFFFFSTVFGLEFSLLVEHQDEHTAEDPARQRG